MKKVVMPPITSTTDSAVSDSSNSGDMRATMKMPAVTIVAAWISAEIGVGPSIESGSHTCSGNCALLPIAPMNRQMQITVISIQSVPGNMSFASSSAFGKTSAYESEPENAAMRPMPRMKPKSPTRLTRKALRFAKIAVGRVYQKPISRYDTTPTASQPKNSCRKLLLMTSISIENVKSEMYAKKRL